MIVYNIILLQFKEAEKNMEEQHVLGELDNQRSKRDISSLLRMEPR